jgi:3-oxoacyl-[acyl-carrier protein] reductase
MREREAIGSGQRVATVTGGSGGITRLRFPTYSAYAASKGAVEALTPILVRELRGRDITLNALAPGPTATDLFLAGKEQQEIDNLAKAPPLGRRGIPMTSRWCASWPARRAGSTARPSRQRRSHLSLTEGKSQ